uniref:Uncharacterized protein n=2 Tax=Cacopsylla melanoneura TaxID=428564 RepID=A0A8D8YIE5_9HEMI
MNYTAPIWSPHICTTNWKKLQTLQNAALRIATGCHLMSHQDHLHIETQVIPIKEHNELLSLQYLTGCLIPSHTCNEIVTATQPPRAIRKTLSNTYLPMLHDKHLCGDTPRYDNHKSLLQRIHTNIVSSTIENYKPNRVLGTNVIPEVDESEKSLPRSTRATLAQLRSSWCKKLQNYKARIDPTESDLCPACRKTTQDVHHLFECPAIPNPNSLDPTSLWTNPVETAAFLNLETM